MIQGNNWANLFQGKSSIELMNAMRFDAMVVGNHEFDYGPKVLQQQAWPKPGSRSWAANVKGLPALKPYVIKNLQGVRVAIIGVVTADTPTSTHPRNVAGLKFSPPDAAAVRVPEGIAGPGRHHGGPVPLRLSAEDRALAQKVPGIDVIIGRPFPHQDWRPRSVVNHTIIGQAWEHAKALGVLDPGPQGR